MLLYSRFESVKSILKQINSIKAKTENYKKAKSELENVIDLNELLSIEA